MSKRKLLLADDSVTVQKVVNLAFESEDIEVITANDGNSAFEKFVEFSPDLVMADINLPGVDGYEICHQIKQDEETKHIPVILLVGSFAPFSEEKAEKVGAEGFLKKPFQSIGLLINKVTELLDMNGDNDSDSSEADFNEADTQPMPTYESSEIMESAYSISDDLGETGMDDEMIETESGTDYSFADETSKYETSTGLGVAEDSKRTQPMTYAEVEELGLMNQNEETGEKTVYELADEPDDYPSTTSFNFGQKSDEKTEETSENQADSYGNYSAYQQPENARTQSFPAPEEATDLELDDFELLELPLLERLDESVSQDYATADESAESTMATTTESEKPETAQTETDYSDQAETTAEESFSTPRTAEPDETKERYYSWTEDSIPQTMQSFETEENFESAETTKFAESYYSPETETVKEEDDSFANEAEEVSASSTEESTEQDFSESETQTETAVEMQEMIATTQQEISQASDSRVVVHYLPPEVIDEIAERVVEKLAEKLRR